jgi:pimeloyl-ACP methyl ester carboxylesterase
MLQGMPYPDQELNAIDIVMQFAIHRLKFQPENILLFGWSIGGYPTSWAAMNYPDVKGVVWQLHNYCLLNMLQSCLLFAVL